ncbi:MAG TPA: molybdopterin cofactor-binding domain-containing protein, partial [Stellaceae bacterium]|nr:molybdopterin cofactor-binding domain-containing protein [Stellaceae bacterium]
MTIVATGMGDRPYVGRPLERLEDASLLTGRGRYADDLPVRADTLHAAILRSPHAHAELVSLDLSAARVAPGVVAVLARDEIKAYSSPFVVGVKQPIDCWSLAVDRVRYVGEPIAVVVAEDRCLAEDALDLIAVDYNSISAVVDPVEAAGEKSPALFPALGRNVVSERDFLYGDPDAAFAAAQRTVGITVRYPRNSCTPIEGFVVVADYSPADGVYDVLANFQGPFSLHPVMARALNVPGNRLRLRTPPDSGGSFGVKQAVFPYVVLMAVAARIAGRPVKWVEDRLENLSGAVSATNRVVRLDAAVEAGGRVTALRWDQIEDCGGYLRAPEPATLYRMHGNLTGAYDIRHLAVKNRVVVTNKTPTGLNRGFGGPQVYFALERLMQRIALDLGLDPLDVIRRNLVRKEAFPYRSAAGALLDSGDYQTAVAQACAEGGLGELKRRRDEARAAGRLYGIGYTAIVEPSVSNMGYITTVMTPAERRKAGPKNGAHATATIAIDPVGSVSVHVASTPQGQGHRTVLAQVVADAFGLKPDEIRVNVELDTQKDAWSIASGNYSSRFAAAVAGTAHLAATKLRQRLARVASQQLNVRAEEIEFARGKIFARGNPDNATSFSRVAGTSHWTPATLPQDVEPTLRETVFWTPPELAAPSDADEINSSAAYGFIFDFCGVAVDRDTGEVTIDKYVTMHDAGKMLNPLLVDGQVRGGFSQAVGAALLEEFSYAPDGGFLSGTFADYLVPTACEVPEPLILHMETPSPFTPLGAKGVGEGNNMSTPVCIANAVADALGVADIELPLTKSRVAALLHGKEQPDRRAPVQAKPVVKGGRALTGQGAAFVRVPPAKVWAILVDPKELAQVIPGCSGLALVRPNSYRADIEIGVGPVRGRYRAEVGLADLEAPTSLTLSGTAQGALGTGAGR